MGKKWTDKEDDVLVTMREQVQATARLLDHGRTAQSCQQRVFKWVKPSRTQERRKWCRKWPL